MGSGAQGQYKINITNEKRKLNPTENGAADFPRFIVIKSLEEICQAKFFSFLIEKVVATRVTPRIVKKIKNSNLLVEVNSWRHAENIFKMKTFHTTKCKAYPYEKLNFSKGVIRSRELSLSTVKEITAPLGKQGNTASKCHVIAHGDKEVRMILSSRVAISTI